MLISSQDSNSWQDSCLPSDIKPVAKPITPPAAAPIAVPHPGLTIVPAAAKLDDHPAALFNPVVTLLSPPV